MGSTQIDIGILAYDKIYSVSPAYHTYKINTTIVNSEYFEWALKELNSQLSNLYMISSARQGKNVDINRMMHHKMYIPSMNKQYDDVKNLKYINELIFKEKNKCFKLDEIVKLKYFGGVCYGL